MNRSPVLFLGALLTVVASLIGLVLFPNWQLSGLAPVTVTDEEGRETQYPRALDAYAELPGRDVYIAQGCIYCHSQQVRAQPFGTDIDRGWGDRRSVPRDYVFDKPPLMGTMRTGPDLANIGMRQPSEQWHHLHLYDARLVTPGSKMPPMPFLYNVVYVDPKDKGFLIPDNRFGRPAWIIPRREAEDLVSYLQARKQEHKLEEVK